jgi:sporulation protein YlmC with PRC-barrel domain
LLGKLRGESEISRAHCDNKSETMDNRRETMKLRRILAMFSGLLVALTANALMAVPPSSTGTPPPDQTTPLGEQATPLGEQATQPGQRQADVQSQVPRDKHATEHSKGMACRAGELIGMSVYNQDGKELGSLEDLVFDPKTGSICYAAVARGGILGIGGKLVAVPWDAFEFQMKQGEQRAFRPDDQSQAESQTGVVSEDRFRLILNLDAKTIEQHPGFDKDNWPKAGDESLLKKGTQPLENTPRAPSPGTTPSEPTTPTRPGS